MFEEEPILNFRNHPTTRFLLLNSSLLVLPALMVPQDLVNTLAIPRLEGLNILI
jgi:hypothetical protein